MDNTHILSSDAVFSFLTAGKALVTVLNTNTEKRHTYEIQAPGKTAEAREKANILFVSVLTGPENTAHYTYIGILVRSSGRSSGEFKLTAKSRLPESDHRVAGFKWVLGAARADALGRFPHVQVRHHNRCGACSRVLTVPESIDNGLGPICTKRLGVEQKRAA